MESNVRIIGKCVSRYSAEVEYFDLRLCRKTVSKVELKSKADIDEFRKVYEQADLIGVVDNPLIVVAVRILKGDEVIYDRYCQFCELQTLTALSEKIRSINRK